MTAVKAVQADLENAGAEVKDEAVVVDHGLVTSRTPDDLARHGCVQYRRPSRRSLGLIRST